MLASGERSGGSGEFDTINSGGGEAVVDSASFDTINSGGSLTVTEGGITIDASEPTIPSAAPPRGWA